MSKIITLTPASGSTITITNTYTAEGSEKKNIALTSLQSVKDNQIWNTGCASANDPHIDEVDNAGKTLLTDPNMWTAKHIAAIPLYRTNSYVYLLPGDSITITARSSEEASYYFNYKSELVTVECNFVTEGNDRTDEDEFVQGTYIDCTTGIGDYSNTISTNQNDSEEETDPEDPQDPQDPNT